MALIDHQGQMFVKNHYGAYGIGVEYVYTMVHGAPATKFPEYAVPVAAAAHK